MSEAIALLGYRPAEYRSGNDNSLVIYYVVHPETKKPVRKRIKLNHISCLKERKKVALKLCSEINSKLHSGWNPLVEQEAPRAFTSLFSALDQYLDVQSRSNLRDDSLRAYRSMVKKFKEWLVLESLEKSYVISFTPKQGVSYMNHVLIDREVSPRTWNNNLMQMKSIWNWFIAQQMAKSNPFASLKKKKAHPKARIIFQGQTLIDVWDKLHEQDRDLYFIARLIYHCLLRPKEITFLRPSDFNFEAGTVRISSHAAKSRRTSYRTIPRLLLPDAKDIVARCGGKDWFVFAGRMQPGPDRIGIRTMEAAWRAFRIANNLSPNLHLYSFKDSGIVDMYNAGIPEPDIQRQADHISGEITRIYADHINPYGIELLRGFRPK